MAQGIPAQCIVSKDGLSGHEPYLVWAFGCALRGQAHGTCAEPTILGSGTPPHSALHSNLLGRAFTGGPQMGAELGILRCPGCTLAGALDRHCKELHKDNAISLSMSML